MSIERYPLSWPAGWRRTPPHKRHVSRYKVTETRARDELLHSLKLLGARNVILSTNIELRIDGLPYANRRAPDDPGVAVYWTRNGQQEVIACDAWKTVKDNYRAVWAAVEALRQLERCGASEILNRAFTGFAALPATASAPHHWRGVLGFSLDEHVEARDVELRYRELSKTRHPDVEGGSSEAFRELSIAKDDALKELGQ